MMADSIVRFVLLFLLGEGGVSAKWVKCGGLTLILSQEEELFLAMSLRTVWHFRWNCEWRGSWRMLSADDDSSVSRARCAAFIQDRAATNRSFARNLHGRHAWGSGFSLRRIRSR